MGKITGYELSRNWFDFCFENPEKIKPNHTALYFFAIEHYNRLGGKEKFGFPSTMAMEAVGIKSYNTYINTLNDLVKWGAIKLIEKSRNQYSANIIAISNFDKAQYKALDKALIKHSTKQSESTVQSIDSIDKQLIINNELNNMDESVYRSFKSQPDRKGNIKDLKITIEEVKQIKEKNPNKDVDSVLDSIENYKDNHKYNSLYLTALKWIKKEPELEANKGRTYKKL